MQSHVWPILVSVGYKTCPLDKLERKVFNFLLLQTKTITVKNADELKRRKLKLFEKFNWDLKSTIHTPRKKIIK